MKAFYFGPWGSPGHYIWTPDSGSARRAGPWEASQLDAKAYDRYGRDTDRGFVPVDPEERQGAWRLTLARDSGGVMWTAIGAYDRTQDHRGGSIAVFVAEGEHDAEAMKRIAAEQFPAVWARITGRPA